jgi:hypothetical protein
MVNPRNDTQGADIATANACGLSLDDHIEQAMVALTMFGAGIACEQEYQALLVIAEVAKILHGHAVYCPVVKAQELAEKCRQMETAEKVSREALETIVVVSEPEGVM